MRLTKKRAIDLSIELWEWLAETGKEKNDWPGWDRFGKLDEFGDTKIENACFFCGYSFPKKPFGCKTGECKKCPLGWGDYGCEVNLDSYYKSWNGVVRKPAKKKYARLFLEQLKELKR